MGLSNVQTQHSATHCGSATLQFCNTAILQHTATYCNSLLQATRQGYHPWKRSNLQHTATLQHIATQCNTLQLSVAGHQIRLSPLQTQQSATHCNTVQYTATLCCGPLCNAITLAKVACFTQGCYNFIVRKLNPMLLSRPSMLGPKNPLSCHVPKRNRIQ